MTVFLGRMRRVYSRGTVLRNILMAATDLGPAATALMAAVLGQG
jgi:hypothetical protein